MFLIIIMTVNNDVKNRQGESSQREKSIQIQDAILIIVYRHEHMVLLKNQVFRQYIIFFALKKMEHLLTKT